MVKLTLVYITKSFERIIGSFGGIFNWSILLAVQNRIRGGLMSIIASPLSIAPQLLSFMLIFDGQQDVDVTQAKGERGIEKGMISIWDQTQDL